MKRSRSRCNSGSVKRKDEYAQELSKAIEAARQDENVKQQCCYRKPQLLPRERLNEYLQDECARLLKPNSETFEEVKGLSEGVIFNFLNGLAVNSATAWAICRVLKRFNAELPYPSVVLQPTNINHLHPWDQILSTAMITACIEPQLDANHHQRTIVTAGQYELYDGDYFRLTINPARIGNDINIDHWYLTLLNRSCRDEYFLLCPLSIAVTDQIFHDVLYIPSKGYKPFRVVGHADGSLRQEEFLAILTRIPLALSWIQELMPGNPVQLTTQDLEQILSRLNDHSDWLSLFTWFDVVTED